MSGGRLRRRLHTVARAAGWYAAVTSTAQVAAVVGVVAVDEIRKRRNPPPGGYASQPPVAVDVGGSGITTYTSGRDLYEAMLSAIEGAQHTIYFESYIWKADDVGQGFKDALVAASQRGVAVYVVYDAFANLVVPPSFYRLPAPIHVLRFPVLRSAMITRPGIRSLGRDHRKILVVDSATGFVGGYNIGRLYADHWRDTHLRVQGPAVWELDNAFCDFWNQYRGRHLPALPDRGAASWDARTEAASNAPSRLLFPVRGIYLKAIDRASERVYITQAYFIPDEEILASLLAAARRGVDVRVIVPEYSNHVVADWVARGYFGRLLAGGVSIWLYRNAMVHAKTATVDGRWSTVGTANIDRLSLTGNYEVNLEVYSDEQAAEMERIFEMDLGNCRRLTYEEWARRHHLARVVERLLKPLQPLL
ncbi:phospholipase D-like domain-containing protein [Mobilicoccus sp.]|uniref:phospholipase D-like domain-containing protein n=1 Tax=Mobilicoccus sp. TaxID=2034349 RepID=UPI0028AA6A1E|nr:phospholipase D-like domain-containing protein [Mobilicoccus sp.]